jgi:hypothetical protein
MLLTTNSMPDVRIRGAQPQEARMAEREYTFALLVAGLDVDDDADCDAFFSAGLDDSVLEDRDGMALATFFRTADSATSALTSAITTIEHEVPGATVLRIDEQLMNLNDLAVRLGRTTESVRLLATAARGPGGFPPPAGIIGRGVRVWRWADVRPWLVQHGIADPDALSETLPPALIAATNLQLDAAAGQAERGA